MASRDMLKQKWFAASESGDDEVIAEILAGWPDLVTEVEADNALGFAASRGRDKVVARLLAACPDLISTTSLHTLHSAAERGHDKVVAQLLAAAPHLIDASDFRNKNVLHCAAEGGNDKVVAQVLAARPSLITSTDCLGWSALSYATKDGHEKVFMQLLAARPQLIDSDRNVLHLAAEYGHDNLVARIVALRPKLVSLRQNEPWTALRYAVYGGHEQVAERLLAINRDEVYEHRPDTLLHTAICHCSRDFVEKLWRMNPAALRVLPALGDDTPFHLAIGEKRDDLIELFQWSLSFDEIVEGFTLLKISYEERYGPVMEKQCQCLLASLNRDVLGTVFEYLGLSLNKRTTLCKRILLA